MQTITLNPDQLAKLADMVAARLREQPVVVPELLSQQDAAKFLAASTAGLRNYVAEGLIVPTKLDGKPRYWVKHLLQVIERHTG